MVFLARVLQIESVRTFTKPTTAVSEVALSLHVALVTPAGELVILWWVAFQFDAAGFAVGIHRHQLAIDPARVDRIIGLRNSHFVKPLRVIKDACLGLLFGGEAQSAGHPLISKYFPSP
jgi:hypothetical protein